MIYEEIHIKYTSHGPKASSTPFPAKGQMRTRQHRPWHRRNHSHPSGPFQRAVWFLVGVRCSVSNEHLWWAFEIKIFKLCLYSVLCWIHVFKDVSDTAQEHLDFCWGVVQASIPAHQTSHTPKRSILSCNIASLQKTNNSSIQQKELHVCIICFAPGSLTHPCHHIGLPPRRNHLLQVRI